MPVEQPMQPSLLDLLPPEAATLREQAAAALREAERTRHRLDRARRLGLLATIDSEQAAYNAAREQARTLTRAANRAARAEARAQEKAVQP